MLKVDRKFIDEIKNATLQLGIPDIIEEAKKIALYVLRKSLHTAMKLEASTIPPYLVAAWSIKEDYSDDNDKVRKLILGVAKEEMLHMMAVANIISATGQAPKIATPDIVLNWGEDKLPVGGNLVPVLAPFSMDLLQNLFMEIEKPKNPVHYVVKTRGEELIDPHFGTIGEFYDAIKELIEVFPGNPFEGGEKRPQIRLYPTPGSDSRLEGIGHKPITNFQIKSKEQAIDVLNWIIDQGEGTSDGPLDGDGDPAHYYRFAEIFNGGKLKKDENEPLGYVYNRAEFPIDCDFNEVHNFKQNPKMKDFNEDSDEYKDLKRFNKHYTKMFKNLQAAYNGTTRATGTSIDRMESMTISATRLLTQYNSPICPSFEWFDN